MLSVAVVGMALAKNVMILMAHPDDEALSAAGIINKAVTNGDTVKVVIVTNGDAGGPIPGVALGLTREGETVSGAALLGLTEPNIIFLGYGDRSILNIYNSPSDTAIFTSDAGETKTYGTSGLGAKDFHSYLYGIPGDYNRKTIIQDIQDVLLIVRPDDIYTASKYDDHPDHRAVNLLLVNALEKLQKQGSGFNTTLHETLIHPPCSLCLLPHRWPEPLVLPPVPFPQPEFLYQSPLDWNLRESLIVPLPMQSADPNTNLKYQTISQHHSQTQYDSDDLFSFVKLDEFFWTSKFSAYPNIAPLAFSVNCSSEDVYTGQFCIKAVDGIVDGIRGIPGDYTKEWATVAGGAGSYIQLNWSQPYSINQVSLYDRPNPDDQVLSGTLSFSDGSRISIGPLPNAATPLDVTFPLKSNITWVRFTVDSVRATALNIGLAEIKVFGVAGTTIPFDFSLTNSGNVTLRPGNSVFKTITANLLSGTAQRVTFSTSGLPSGAEAFYSQASCSPPCSATLTIYTSASTPAGSYSVTVKATGGVTRTTTFNLTIVTTPLFVIGNGEPHAIGDVVNFWGAQWWKKNQMSGFISNGVASFKGFVDQADNFCGGTWTSRPGNSSNPPRTIPDFVAIIITDTVAKNGPNISGDIKEILIVHQYGGYGPDPGHQGNGRVTSLICKGNNQQ